MYCRNYVFDRFIVIFVRHIKDKIYLITCREGIEGEYRYSSTPSLTSALCLRE